MLLTLIVVLPLVGFFINGLLGNRLGKPFVTAVGCGLPILAFVLAVKSFMDLMSGGGTPNVETAFTWARTRVCVALTRAFAHALSNLPIFAGRMAMVNGTMRIRCEGKGVPFTSASSGRTLHAAIRSAKDDASGPTCPPATPRTGVRIRCCCSSTASAAGSWACTRRWTT